jgi:hypothetical protein
MVDSALKELPTVTTMLSGNLFPRPLVRQGINQLNIFEPLTLGRFYDQKKVRNTYDSSAMGSPRPKITKQSI